MILIYNLFIRFYFTIAKIGAATGNKKAQEWIAGRRHLFQELKNNIQPSEHYIWIHCASAGELEQGKPVIEALKKTYPNHKILISFFSPSGYKAGKKYAVADLISYLPLDTKQNAKHFIETVQPKLVVFVKYEYWYHHLKTVRQNNIPLVLISAIFRKEQVFFKWYGLFYRNILHLFSYIFLQDGSSYQLLKTLGVEHGSIAGDTRFDRVIAITTHPQPIAYIDTFTSDQPVLVAGSTWPDDEQMIAEAVSAFTNLQLIIAPHEITASHITHLQHLFPDALLYSKLSEISKHPENTAITPSGNKPAVLIIDNVGMLSRLYQYATIAYIGGGFNKSGIHNTLEAAVWGKPVLFGPNYQKFKEARDLIAMEGASSVQTAGSLKQIIHLLLNDTTELQERSAAARNYVHQNKGATEKIVHYIQENRLLTS
ncbi:MAG: 3-deoxy-D-manno-octulosonic acid transferase [Bacteroidota bacterium]|nr:3-deoxy-D-manno-octulosonic acid transferase [Bacteroidota bacterium]